MIFIVFGDTIPDTLNNHKHQPIVTELFTTSREINVSFIFITQYYLLHQ